MSLQADSWCTCLLRIHVFYLNYPLTENDHPDLPIRTDMADTNLKHSRCAENTYIGFYLSAAFRNRLKKFGLIPSVFDLNCPTPAPMIALRVTLDNNQLQSMR